MSRMTKLQLLRGFDYNVEVSEISKVYYIVELETNKESNIMDDMELYKQLKKAYRKSKKTLDDMCKEIMQ